MGQVTFYISGHFYIIFLQKNAPNENGEVSRNTSGIQGNVSSKTIYDIPASYRTPTINRN